MAMKDRGRKGTLCEISFRPAEGGVISETRTVYKRGGQGGGPDVDYDHETAVHPTLEHAVKHLKKELAPHFEEESGDRSQESGDDEE